MVILSEGINGVLGKAVFGLPGFVKELGEAMVGLESKGRGGGKEQEKEGERTPGDGLAGTCARLFCSGLPVEHGIGLNSSTGFSLKKWQLQQINGGYRTRPARRAGPTLRGV